MQSYKLGKNMKNILLSFVLLFGVILNAKVLTSNELQAKYKKEINSINTKQLVELLKKKPNTRIIDVRLTKDAINQGGVLKVNKLSRISRDKLEFSIGRLVKPDDTFVVHCFTGNISLLAVKSLKDMGYKNVIWYKDSFKGWRDAGLETRTPDAYPDSMLYSKVQKIGNGVYTSIGEKGPSTYENSGHNNNLGFVIGNKSVLVWNAGANYLLAKSFHEEIKKITNKPVKYVALENSQGHAAFGSNYWKEQGATIISQEIAKKELKNKSISHAKETMRDKFLGTKLTLPDVTFKKNKIIDLGGIKVELKYFGYAHEHSDIVLWIPSQKILFAGDLAFYQRMLPIFKITNVNSWLKGWEKLEDLKAKIVVPGHGVTTDMAHVRVDTKDYLIYIQSSITKILDDDGGIKEAYEIDQSAYEHLDIYELLAKRNVAVLFQVMEFE
jgi:glyoxylase-like metal-dependent hydrolase (beta-lactamase superfamily II)/rhodanese-related sulfurtransferase